MGPCAHGLTTRLFNAFHRPYLYLVTLAPLIMGRFASLSRSDFTALSQLNLVTRLAPEFGCFDSAGRYRTQIFGLSLDSLQTGREEARGEEKTLNMVAQPVAREGRELQRYSTQGRRLVVGYFPLIIFAFLLYWFLLRTLISSRCTATRL